VIPDLFELTDVTQWHGFALANSD